MSDFTLSLFRNLKYNFPVDEKLTTKEFIVFRTKFCTSEEVHSFVREVEYVTNTNFVVRLNRPKVQKLLFRKRWLCQHSNFRKKPTSKTSTGCKSFIDVRIKKVNKHTIRNDHYLKKEEPLPCVIKINLKHTHSTEDENVLKKLRVTPEIKKKFYQYFESGLSACEAKRVHESQLVSCYDRSILSDASVNPTGQQIYYLHTKWYAENIGPTCDPFGKPAHITSISIRDLVPFINMKYQKNNSADCSEDVHCPNNEIKKDELKEELLVEEGSKINCLETVIPEDYEQITIMNYYSLSSENFPAKNTSETYSEIMIENTDINLISDQTSLHVKEEFTFKYLLNNISQIREPNNFWGISSHSNVIICARWNENFICTKKVVIEDSLILRVFLSEWEINLSEFLSVTCIEDVCNVLEKVENSIKCHR